MAFSPLRPKALHHGRSFSLSSQSHPSISHFNENLAKIQASSSSDITSSSLSSMETRVNGLRNLYCNIGDVLMLPHIQQIIVSQQCQTKWIDQVLDGYISLLDACTIAKDIFSLIKHDVQDLLCALRRNNVNGINSYLISRKKSKKIIVKSLKDLSTLKCKKTDSSLEKDDETTVLVCMLKGAESITIHLFECLFSYVMGTKVQTKSNGWSLVSKILPTKKVCHQCEETYLNKLKEMESSIQVLEEEIDFLFRQLIKIRVLMLNIVNH